MGGVWKCRMLALGQSTDQCIYYHTVRYNLTGLMYLGVARCIQQNRQKGLDTISDFTTTDLHHRAPHKYKIQVHLSLTRFQRPVPYL